MKILINERLSEHRYKTPEGYLICTDAILARTGKQTYRKNEIFKDSDDETEIEVDRTEDEVFAPQTLASFENKPVTVEHPDEDVNVHNYKEYAVGFVRDVHRGVVNGQPVILGNLVITDEKTIQEIENGEHTDLSCGYDCDIVDEPNPCQRNIRGNHVALCECGRAGIARIVDSKVDDAKLKLPIGYIETTNPMGFHYIRRADHARLMPTEILKIEEALRAAGISAEQVEYDISDRWVGYRTSGRLSSHGYIDSMNDASSIVPAMKVANLTNGYAIVPASEWRKFGLNSEVERFTTNLDEARYIRSSLERNDGISFIIVDVTQRRTTDSMKDTREIEAFMKDSDADVDKLQQLIAETISARADAWRNDKQKELRQAKEDIANAIDASRNIRSDIKSFYNLPKYVRQIAERNARSELERYDELLNIQNKIYEKYDLLMNEANSLAKIIEAKYHVKLNLELNRSGGEREATRILKTIRKQSDSLNDALIPPTKESINMFESLLRTSNIKIDRKGLTTFGRVHYQVHAFMPFNQFVKKLDLIDDEMNKLGIPMTFSAGADGDGDVCTAGIDLDKQYVKDSQRDQKIQKIIKVVKSIK